MALAKDYKSVMGRSNDIMKEALGLDYNDFESGSVAFDYEALMKAMAFQPDYTLAPVASTKKLLNKLNMTIEDMDLIEANEAFAAQSLAVAKELNFDMSKVNVNGGAIALGHPVGASGCRILVTLLHAMKKRGAKTGLATLCIGGGMGCSTIVKKCD